MCGFRKHKFRCFFRCFSDLSPTMKCRCCLMTWFVKFFRLFFFASELAHATNKKWILLLSFAFLSFAVLRLHKLENWNIHGNFPSPASRSRLPMCTPNTRAKFFKFIFLSLDGAWKADDVHHMGFSCFSICVKIIFIRPDPSGWMSPNTRCLIDLCFNFSILFSVFFFSSKINLFRVFSTMMHLTVSQRSVFSKKKKKCFQLFDSTVLKRGKSAANYFPLSTLIFYFGTTRESKINFKTLFVVSAGLLLTSHQRHQKIMKNKINVFLLRTKMNENSGRLSPRNVWSLQVHRANWTSPRSVLRNCVCMIFFVFLLSRRRFSYIWV